MELMTGACGPGPLSGARSVVVAVLAIAEVAPSGRTCSANLISGRSVVRLQARLPPSPAPRLLRGALRFITQPPLKSPSSSSSLRQIAIVSGRSCGQSGRPHVARLVTMTRPPHWLSPHRTVKSTSQMSNLSPALLRRHHRSRTYGELSTFQDCRGNAT